MFLFFKSNFEYAFVTVFHFVFQFIFQNKNKNKNNYSFKSEKFPKQLFDVFRFVFRFVFHFKLKKLIILIFIPLFLLLLHWTRTFFFLLRSSSSSSHSTILLSSSSFKRRSAHRFAHLLPADLLFLFAADWPIDLLSLPPSICPLCRRRSALLLRRSAKISSASKVPQLLLRIRGCCQGRTRTRPRLPMCGLQLLLLTGTCLRCRRFSWGLFSVVAQFCNVRCCLNNWWFLLNFKGLL